MKSARKMVTLDSLRLGLAALLFTGFLASSGAAVAEEDPYSLTVTAFATPGTPWDADWQTFRAYIDAHAGVRIKLKLLVRGEAGGEPIMISNIRRNRTQFGGFTLNGAAAVIPELSVLTAPFLFESEEELDFVMDEYMLETLQPLFAAKALVLIRWAETGWLNMYGQKPQPAVTAAVFTIDQLRDRDSATKGRKWSGPMSAWIKATEATTPKSARNSPSITLFSLKARGRRQSRCPTKPKANSQTARPSLTYIKTRARPAA